MLRDFVVVFIKVISPLFIWPVAGMLQPASFGRKLALASAFSFPIFLMHAPMLQLAHRLLPALFASDGTAHAVAWLAATTGTAALCAAFYLIALRCWPRAAAIAFGGRA
jgi:hypothetical protein